MTKPIGLYASAFWGHIGTSESGRGQDRDTLFGHHVIKVRDSLVTLWYTVPPATDGTDRDSAFPETLFVGRPFLLQPGAALPAGAEAEERSVVEFLRSLDGRFRLFLRRGPSLVVATDSLGMAGVFYGVFDDTLFFGTHLGPLLEILPRCPAPNRLAVASLLLSYTQLFDETHFSGVQRLQAGQLLEGTWNPRQARVEVRTRGYCDPAEMLLRGRPEAGDPAAFEDLLRASQDREGYDESTAIMLSGGHDSKAIALTKPPKLGKAISYGTRDSIDVRHGRRLARKLGMTHYTVPYEGWSLDTYFEFIVGLNAGFSGLQTSYNIVAYDWARSICPLAVNGFLGDTLTGAPLRRVTKMDTEGIQESMLRGPRELVAEVFPEETVAVNDRVTSLWERYRALPPAHALLILKLCIANATWISMSFDLCGWLTAASYPFFYRPLMQMLFALPAEELRGQPAYYRWLARMEQSSRVEVTRTDALREQIESRYHRWRYRRPVADVVVWSDVIARTDPTLATRHAGVMEELDRLTRDSWQRALRAHTNASFPLLAITIPLAAAFQQTGSSWSCSSPRFLQDRS